jgi:hypothetical protein
MFTAPDRAVRRAAFTLLEITLATVILAMMSLAIYRFVQGNITALRISSEQTAIDDRYTGLLSLLTTQWQSLPAGLGALTGEPFKFGDRPRDEITWVCSAGPGLLTRYAAGDYFVTLRIRPVKTGSDTMEMGLTRRPQTAEVGGEVQESWVPLINNVGSLQIRYFDPRLNSWVERWTDTTTLPRLVRLTIGRADMAKPWEAIVALGRTPL